MSGDGNRIFFDESSLHISNAITSDTGFYTCAVRARANGNMTSAFGSVYVAVEGTLLFANQHQFVLDVLLGRTMIEPVVDHVRAPEGGSASLECQGEGFYSIRWFHQWEAISESDTYHMSFSPLLGKGRLNITQVHDFHSGSYQCQGGEGMASILLTVQEVKQTVMNAFLNDYTSVLLTCDYVFPNNSNRANVLVSWLKEGVALNSHQTQSRLYYGEGVAHAIENATCADSGLYTCLIYIASKLDAACYTNLIVESKCSTLIMVF